MCVVSIDLRWKDILLSSKFYDFFSNNTFLLIRKQYQVYSSVSKSTKLPKHCFEVLNSRTNLIEWLIWGWWGWTIIIIVIVCITINKKQLTCPQTVCWYNSWLYWSRRCRMLFFLDEGYSVCWDNVQKLSTASPEKQNDAMGIKKGISFRHLVDLTETSNPRAGLYRQVWLFGYYIHLNDEICIIICCFPLFHQELRNINAHTQFKLVIRCNFYTISKYFEWKTRGFDANCVLSII